MPDQQKKKERWYKLFDDILKPQVFKIAKAIQNEADAAAERSGYPGIALILDEGAFDSMKEIFVTKTIAMVNLMGAANNLSASPDRHRISALLAIAILESRPLSHKSPGADVDPLRTSKVSIDISHPNESLAIDSSLLVLFTHIAKIAIAKGDKTTIAILRRGYPHWPPTTMDGVYRQHLILALYHGKNGNNPSGLTPFLLAHILFWLEHYTLYCPSHT
ncbi:MAG: hypothetical protein HQL75_14675 [Magnetococcales bacterium]|nr:hypothetical protein [Magnetococcales bacterium]